jgi:uncharacterized surface protein with fasciclin (FAS1) repeats
MKIKNQFLYAVIIVALSFFVNSCTEPSKDVERLPTIVDIANADPANFSILVAALTKTGLATTFTGAGSYTVFAPTNAAFARIPAYSTKERVDALNAAVPADLILINDLRTILQYHVQGIGTRSSDLLAAGYSRTFAFYKSTPTATSGPNLTMFINKPAADVLINGGSANGGATVTTADIDARNGIVHVIDRVLALPTIVQQAVANPLLSSLVRVVTSTPQAAVLSALNGATAAAPLTVYAPIDAAFKTATDTGGYLVGKSDADVTRILQYHVERSNRVATSTTAFSTTADLTVTTLLATPTALTLLIPRSSVRIVDRSNPAVNATASIVNIQAANGSVHVINKVLTSI